jgi:hypothetical protein
LKVIIYLIGALVALPVSAQVPLSAQAWQLEQLIQQSQEQLKTVQEILKYEKHDTESLEKAAKILDRLTAGLDDSIEKYQGTPVYEQALLQAQTESARAREAPTPEPPQKTTERFLHFQSDSLKANRADLDNQRKLDEALKTAGPGFVPKIQSEAQLGAWRTGTRVSTQLSELLTATRDLQNELNSKNQPGVLDQLLKGAEVQNQKQREVSRDELR